MGFSSGAWRGRDLNTSCACQSWTCSVVCEQQAERVSSICCVTCGSSAAAYDGKHLFVEVFKAELIVVWPLGGRKHESNMKLSGTTNSLHIQDISRPVNKSLKTPQQTPAHSVCVSRSTHGVIEELALTVLFQIATSGEERSFAVFPRGRF